MEDVNNIVIMKEVIKQYRFAILLVSGMLLLVLLRDVGPDRFRPDAAKCAEPSVLRSNILTTVQLESLQGTKLLINLGNTSVEAFNIPSVNIAPGLILDRKNLNLIRNNKGPVLLFSKDNAVSAEIWMLLSQIGIKNLFILSPGNDEIFKYKFRPDSLVRPES
jgi:hypothetical protein